MYHPAIMASFDEFKYIDREVFTPLDGEYDFRKFTLESPGTHNYTAYISCSGYVQMVDDKGNRTVNVLEWGKMTLAWWRMLNESFTAEMEKPSHIVDGVRVVDVVVYDGRHLYASYAYDSQTSTLVYIATPCQAETVGMIRSVEFKH